MFDPFDDSLRRYLRQIQQHQDQLRHAHASLPLLDRIRLQEDVLSGALPGIDAVRSLMERRGTPTGFDRSFLDLIQDSTRFEMARRSSLEPSIQLLEALDRARDSLSPYRPVSGMFGSIETWQASAELALKMQARIGEAVADRALGEPLRGLMASLASLTDEAGRTWTALTDRPELIESTPEFLREFPTRQVTFATRSTGLVVTNDPEFVTVDADTEAGAGLLADDAGELEELLARVNPQLVALYRGALSAFKRGGPDYVRQVTVSLRELFVHLLREIAPETQIGAWNPDVLPASGKVTYKARLLYVFRSPASSQAYGRLAVGDVDHILQNFFVLEGEGIHKLTSDLEREELRLVIHRCEYALVTILRVYQLSS